MSRYRDPQLQVGENLNKLTEQNKDILNSVFISELNVDHMSNVPASKILTNISRNFQDCCQNNACKMSWKSLSSQ